MIRRPLHSIVVQMVSLRCLVTALCLTAIVGSAIVLTGCTRVVQPQPQNVSITYKPVLPNCYLSEMPEAPELLELDFAEEDIWKRTSVNWLTGNKIIQWERDMVIWLGEMKTCLAVMNGTEP